MLGVVINLEEQYSFMPLHEGNPPGWRDAGKTGSKRECMDYIVEVWTECARSACFSRKH